MTVFHFCELEKWCWRVYSSH